MQLQSIVNNMKRFLPIIIGVFAGVAASYMLIAADVNLVAYGENDEDPTSTWDEIVANGNLFEWTDIFTPSKQGTDLYQLVYGKLLVAPENDALDLVAQKYGLTNMEAERVVGGSITPIFNNPDIRSADLTQENAFILFNNLQEDFEDLHETFELQQEIDAAIAPSEIFANGDLFDSGFDLVHDLSIIEEILFVEVIPNTVGKPFGGELSSPYIPTDPIVERSDYAADEGPVAVMRQPLDEEGNVETDIRIDSAGSEISEFADAIGDIEKLESDVCAVDDPFAEAANSYEADKIALKEAEADESDDPVVVEDGDDNDGVPATDETRSVSQPIVAADGTVSPAPVGDWGSTWCPALGGAEGSAAADSTFGSSGFSSLGNAYDSLIGQSAGAAAGVAGPGFSAKIGICLDTELIRKTVSSFNPGDSCILCEVEKTNEFMKKTLNHTLIPNKVTGNIFESAKCKGGFDLVMPDLQVITIAAPIPTPPNDDLILGKNIFEEWNSFVEKYRPFLGDTELLDLQIGIQPTFSTDYETDFLLATAPEGTTIAEIINEVSRVQDKARNEALLEAANLQESNKGTNTKLFNQTALPEIKQMRIFFEGYNRQYKLIDNECNAIKNKPNA